MQDNYSHFMVDDMQVQVFRVGEHETPRRMLKRWCDLPEGDDMVVKHDWETRLIAKCPKCQSSLDKYGYKEATR